MFFAFIFWTPILAENSTNFAENTPSSAECGDPNDNWEIEKYKFTCTEETTKNDSKKKSCVVTCQDGKRFRFIHFC